MLSIVLISTAMHYKHFKKELIGIHVWRQTQTQSTINSFYEEDFNLFNPKRNNRGSGDGVFRMEFPLMQWGVAALYKIFGNHLVISRIFMFIIGLFSVFGIYKLLHNIFQNYKLALVGAWTFNFSPCFYYYTINPLPDNLALCCSIWGLAFFFSWLNKRSNYLLVLCSFLLCIGTLCKLPFVLYYIVPATYFIINIFQKKSPKENILNGFKVASFIIFPLAWYVSVVPQWHGNGVVSGVFDNTVSWATVLDYMQHNLISTLPELLVNYGSMLFFLAGFYFLVKNKVFKNPLFPVFIAWSAAILFYFFFELNMIAKIHDYYLFPFYPLIFILVSYGAYNMLSLNSKFITYLTGFLFLLLPFTVYLRMQNRWNESSPGFNKDLFVYKQELRNAVPKDALCIAGNDESQFIYLYYIDKKGWNINNDELDVDSLKSMIHNGAKFLYSDSRKMDEKEELVPFLDKLILEKGSIKIFSLKEVVLTNE